MSIEATSTGRVRFGRRELGRFAIPNDGGNALTEPRQLLAAPEWNDLADRRVLSWMEVTPSGPVVVTWIPGNSQEQAEAERLFVATHSRSWYSYEQLLSEPRQAGEWLLGYEYGGSHMYVLPLLDEQRMAEPIDGPHANEPFFATDPREAAVMTHDRAIQLVPRMMEKFDLTENSQTFFEPVRLADAIIAYDGSE